MKIGEDFVWPPAPMAAGEYLFLCSSNTSINFEAEHRPQEALPIKRLYLNAQPPVIGCPSYPVGGAYT